MRRWRQKLETAEKVNVMEGDKRSGLRETKEGKRSGDPWINAVMHDGRSTDGVAAVRCRDRGRGGGGVMEVRGGS